MDALKQYLDLYNEHGSTINAHSVPALNALRPAAFEALQHARLPRKGSEDYEATDIEALFAPDYGLNITRLDYDIDPAESFRCDVPNLSTCLFHTFNDVPRISATSRRNLDGAIVETLTEAAISHPEVLAKHLGRLAAAGDATVSLNTLLAQDGMFIYVPRGVKAGKPLQLLNILSAKRDTMSNT